jgi:hypothetical protein
MGSRTDRFGFITFDNDSDDLAYHNHQAFVADRISMDRLLRIACEAHTHTGIVLSEIPPPAPQLQVSPDGGCLPANQPVYYKVAIVDMYGQERIASAPAVAYTAPQVETPGTPTLRPYASGNLPPGDYQYAVSAMVGGADNETAMSNIVTGSLVPPNSMWYITPPPLPSGATGWNLYRKAPTEIGFRRLYTEPEWLEYYNDLVDDGYYQRGFEQAPEENTTNVTSSITVDLNEPLEAGQSCKIYRTLDEGDWESSFVAWTPSLPFTDQGFPTSVGYPPDIGAGVGGAPKIRLGVDTTGKLPPRRITPTYTAMFNIRGQVQVGYWRWQWINEFDEFHLLRMRANLGRDSWADAAPVKIALDVRRAWDREHWERFTLYEQPLLLEIPQLANGGTLVFPENTQPNLLLYPGDGLRVAIMQSGLGFGTDHNLSISVVGAVRHGPEDSSDWSS